MLSSTRTGRTCWAEWALEVTPEEIAALSVMLDTCDETSALRFVDVETATPFELSKYGCGKGRIRYIVN